MSRILLYDAPYISVEYDSAHYIYANWKGYLTVQQVKEGVYRVLEGIITYGCGDVLNDNRELLGSWTQAIQILSTEVMPKMVAGGLKRVAFIYSKFPSARYSVDRFLEINDQYTGQPFEDYQSALEWLTENRVSEVRTEGNLTIREKGQHKVLNISEISYIYSVEGECLIHIRQQLHTTRLTLKELLQRLPADQFMQVHRSYIINVLAVDTLQYYAGGAYHVYLQNMPRLKIPVSASYVAALKVRLGIMEKGNKEKSGNVENPNA